MNDSDGLYRFALRLTKNEDHAKDLVQDAFERVWIKHKDIDAVKVKSYLFRIVHNSFIDFTRKKKTISLESQVEPMLNYNLENPDVSQQLQQALDKLSDVQKSAVLLRDYEGYNYKEIGQILGLNEAQVKVYIFRARKQLQTYIGSIEALIG